jgi:hypothetical protein
MCIIEKDYSLITTVAFQHIKRNRKARPVSMPRHAFYLESEFVCR